MPYDIIKKQMKQCLRYELNTFIKTTRFCSLFCLFSYKDTFKFTVSLVIIRTWKDAFKNLYLREKFYYVNLFLILR